MALRICVTGAAGQVGKVITRAAVNKGHTVFGVDLPPRPDFADAQRGSYSYQQLDVCDIGGLRRYVEENQCDAMVHMAAVLNNPNRTIKGKEWTESVSCRWVHVARECDI
jgi:UDP-glucose 4-epimerase